MGFGPFFVSGAWKRMASAEAKVEPAVSGMGYELVDVQSSNGGPVLRVVLVKPCGITVADCAAVGRPLTRPPPVVSAAFHRLAASSPRLPPPLPHGHPFSS